jgi:hypothetical protein
MNASRNPRAKRVRSAANSAKEASPETKVGSGKAGQSAAPLDAPLSEARSRRSVLGSQSSHGGGQDPTGAPGDDKAGGSSGSCRDGCAFTFNLRTTGDIHIHNYCAPPDKPSTDGQGDGDDCLVCATQGSCLPPVAGAKHKLSRAQKLAIRAARSKVPSLLAASTMHAIRRHIAGYTPANALEQRLFGKLDALPPALLRCIVEGLDQIPPGQRGPLLTDDAYADPAEPLDPGQLVIGLVEEIEQRAAESLFGDPAAVERPGKDRLYVPVGEDFFNQVRICRIEQLRTASYIPLLQPQEYTPQEVQQSCQLVIGEPQPICEVQTTNCPGNMVAGVCGVVLDVAQGESLELEGVNYFDVNAKVRLIDKDTNTISRDVEAFIYGDADTPRDEVVNGASALINDCRVHDKATFTVPSDIPPGIYQVQVVVPNSVNNPGFGAEIASNVEYINVLPPPTARYQIVVERIIARRETAPASWGSDEVGLRTIACGMSLSGNALDMKETSFKDRLDGVEFDSGTARNVERVVFASDQPILAVVVAVLGHEIDSEGAYNDQINEWSDIFVDLIKDQWEFLLSLISAGGGLGAVIKAVGWKGAIAAAAVAVVVIAIDFVYSLWAPADLIIEDNIVLSIIDLDRLTSVAAPVPPASSFTSNGGIKVNVNKTIPPEKVAFQYRETREYVSDEEESRYELTYRYNRLA